VGKKKTRPLPQELGLPSGGADSHVHLDFPAFAGKLEQTLEKAQKTGISNLGQVFLGAEAYRRGKGLFDPFPGVFFILGIHPHDASRYSQQDLEPVASAVQEDSRIKALGEMGLDYYYLHSTPAEQEKAFAAQLELALDLDLPVVIHSRNAEQETLKILLDKGFKERKVLWHCFGQDVSLAWEILDQGWYISVPGSITFPKNTLLREAVAKIPADRLLLETDCPFIAPEPYRGKQNEPSLLAFTALESARVRGMDPSLLWVQCGDNCRGFFGLDQS